MYKKYFFKTLIIGVFAILATQTFAQKDPNRVYRSQLTGDMIAAYELERAPQLVADWFKTNDAAQRHAIELQLVSFSHMDEQTALRAHPINLDRQAFSSDEIRLVHFERNAYFYQRRYRNNFIVHKFFEI